MVECKIDEYWIARIQYWPHAEPQVTIIYVYYVWQNGEVDFIPFSGTYGGDPIRSTQCARFELLEKIEVEKYK